MKFISSVMKHFYLHLLSLICYSKDKTHISISIMGRYMISQFQLVYLLCQFIGLYIGFGEVNISGFQMRSFIMKADVKVPEVCCFKMTSLKNVDLTNGQVNKND